jgi:hypothetical protein
MRGLQTKIVGAGLVMLYSNFYPVAHLSFQGFAVLAVVYIPTRVKMSLTP